MTNGDNLYINFKVVLPNRLSEERKMYIKKLIQTKTTGDSNLQQPTEGPKEIKFLDELNDNELTSITHKINKLNINNESTSNNYNSSSFEEESFGHDFMEDQVPTCNQQ